jgi:hypothetical protein
MSNDLPRQQQTLHDLLLGRGDVPIATLYGALFSEPRPAAQQQMWLGPYITRLNRRLAKAKLRVEPGALKGTYRLVAVR